jgi:hypothetical protein
MAPRRNSNWDVPRKEGSGKGRGLSPTARLSEGLNYYSGQYAIEEERVRNRVNETKFKSSDMIPIHWDPNTTYYHPPDESSRVESFRFVAKEGQPGAVGYNGILFVRFIKNGTPWKYLNVPEHIYQSFASAQSKGRYINSVLNNFPNSRAAPDEEKEFFLQSQM